jgi:hypothetical protein
MAQRRMYGRWRSAGLVLVGLAAGVLLAVPTSLGSSESTGPGTIQITNREVARTRVDLDPPGTSPGDMEIIRQLLFNRRVTTKSIGRAELLCTFTDGRRSRICRGTYFLPRGKLVVGGSLIYMQFYELAVLGGTGLYDNARGTLTVTRMARRPTRDVVLFRLAG